MCFKFRDRRQGGRDAFHVHLRVKNSKAEGSTFPIFGEMIVLGLSLGLLVHYQDNMAFQERSGFLVMPTLCALAARFCDKIKKLDQACTFAILYFLSVLDPSSPHSMNKVTSSSSQKSERRNVSFPFLTQISSLLNKMSRAPLYILPFIPLDFFGSTIRSPR